MRPLPLSCTFRRYCDHIPRVLACGQESTAQVAPRQGTRLVKAGRQLNASAVIQFLVEANGKRFVWLRLLHEAMLSQQQQLLERRILYARRYKLREQEQQLRDRRERHAELHNKRVVQRQQQKQQRQQLQRRYHQYEQQQQLLERRQRHAERYQQRRQQRQARER